MKNEIIEFFNKNTNDIEFLLDDSKILLSNGKANDKRTYILCNILSEIIRNSLFGENYNELFSELKEKIKPEALVYLMSILKDEKENFISYYREIENIQIEKIPRLLDIEWKFVGLTSINKSGLNELEPKILLNLIFNNGVKKVIETDFANFKKFHEELDISLNYFNSSYAKRINTFSK